MRGRPAAAGGAGSSPRWGVLGGTFDPVHYGHLVIAEQTRESLDLAGVLFLPAAQPPHKTAVRISAAEHRLAMVELAIAGNPGFALLRSEIERGGRSYTVETMGRLTSERPADRFVFIVSTEAALDLPTWREPRRLLELCEIAVVPRLGYPLVDAAWPTRHFPGLEDRFLFVDSPALGHSASDIRARAAAGRTIRYLVPAVVQAYIDQHRLYREADERPAT
ncbi:MAG: nicotinate-nucleotide adenylyltransferase [Chloroflexota bacterium]|nr:nicotinate-nucleotide adenylyltransferase [Chloroflexota bacterium]